MQIKVLCIQVTMITYMSCFNNNNNNDVFIYCSILKMGRIVSEQLCIIINITTTTTKTTEKTKKNSKAQISCRFKCTYSI